MIDHARVRSVLRNCTPDVIPQGCMFSPLLAKAGYSCKCVTLLRGTFSLWASSHLINQPQEMSLLADWPCVFLWRPPIGTSDMHSLSLWQNNHLPYLSPSLYHHYIPPLPPLSCTLTSRHDVITITFALISPSHMSFPFFPLCPCPLLTSPPRQLLPGLSSSHRVPKLNKHG